MNQTPMQSRFIRSELLTLAITGAFGRANVYADDASEPSRQRVRATLRQLLEKLATRYERGVDEAQHLRHIAQLAAELTAAHTGALEGGHFRIGPAQKALNLYLKYLWCLGDVTIEPPHCPVDSIVLRAAGVTGVAWTRMDSLDQYRDCIAAIRRAASTQGIARWECDLWNEARQETIAL